MGITTRVSFTRPTIRDHAYVSAVAVADQTATDLALGTKLDLGSIGAGTNGDCRGLTLKYAAGFDDSLYDDIRLWIVNMLDLTDHSVEIAVDDRVALVFPTGTADVAISGSQLAAYDPYHANSIFANGAVADIYTPATKLLESILIQAQGGTAPETFDWSKVYMPNPALVIEMPRVDKDVTSLSADYDTMDIIGGQLFTFSEVELYGIRENANGDEMWQLIAQIKDQSFDINDGEEVITWTKGKPAIPYHQAISEVMTEVKFQLDEETPKFIASAFDEVAVDNATDATIDFSLTGLSRPVVYQKFGVQWYTQGGFLVRKILPKVKLVKSGSMTPGGDDFAGSEYTMTTLAADSFSKVLSTLKVTKVPTEQLIIPLTWAA